MCRSTQTTPLAWHRSKAFGADKNNGRQGVLGKRIMHAYCSVGMSWHAGIHRRGTPFQHATWAQGGLPHRCRENALATLMTMKWKAEQLGYSSVYTSYDCSN
eukprot:666387-Pyramimonas_sp.AAC.1